MHIKRILARGIVLLLAVAVGFASFGVAYATTKKSKHAKPSHAASTVSAPAGSQPAPPGPPDPGVYK
jgi:hypothetical protein